MTHVSELGGDGLAGHVSVVYLAALPLAWQVDGNSGVVEVAAEASGHVAGTGGLVRYQGQSRRRRSMSAGSLAERAYQVMSRVWMRNPNGTVRSTAFRVRLQASPTPRTCLPAALDGSMGHRQE